MSVARYIMLICDHEVGTDLCNEESDAEMTETATRREARKEGWKVGRNRQDNDYCPKHRGLYE